MFNDTTLASYHNFPIDARDFGAIDHKMPNEVNMNLQIKYQGANIKSSAVMNFNDSKLKINGGITLTVNPTTEMNFSGINGGIETFPNSQMIFPQDFVINLKSNTYSNCNGTNFSTLDEGIYWNGFYSLSPSLISFQNCTFNNTYSSVRVIDSYNNPINIINNNFNIPLSNALDIQNAKRIYIYGNNFLLSDEISSSSSGIKINNFNLQGGVSKISIVLENNYFRNGKLHLIIKGLAGNYMPIFVTNNYFGDSPENIVLMYVSGDITNNIINNNFDYHNAFALFGFQFNY